MDALSLHSKILEGYQDYIRSFIDIHDDDIRENVEKALQTRKLWPEPRSQHLVEAHERFSSLVEKKRFGVVHPVLPMDVLGLYVLMPVT